MGEVQIAITDDADSQRYVIRADGKRAGSCSTGCTPN
jgi:hypothetical protein